MIRLKIARRIFSAFIIILFFIFLFSQGTIYPAKDLEYGLTFSKKQAISFGLDWQTVFNAIISELNVKKLRLSAYWDEIEPVGNQYSWNDLDWQIQAASSKNIEIILAIGGRLPRWPECHFPGWLNNLPPEEKEKELLDYIKETILRYKDEKQIIAWQIENEPFLSHFGECPELNKDLLDQEILLAHSLDSRPIVITDSGELSIWAPAAQRADIFGTTMYRDTYSKVLHSYVHYPITPGFFRFKKNIVSIFAHPKKWIVIELQAEPWGPAQIKDLSQIEKNRTMNPEKFREIIEFSARTGFKEFYLWGAEWWYWERSANNNNLLWEEAKGIFKK